MDLKQNNGYERGPRPKGLSLRAKLVVEFGTVILVILVLVIVVTTLGVPFTGYTGSFGNEKTLALATLSLVADLKKEAFELLMEQRGDDIKQISESINSATLLIDILALIRIREHEGKSPDEFWAQLTKEPSSQLLVHRFDQIIAAYKAYQSMQIADASTGIVVVSSDKEKLGSNVSGTPSFDKALKSAHEVIVVTQGDSKTGRPILILSRAIFGPAVKDSASRAPLGVVMCYIDIGAYFKPLFQTSTNMGKIGDIVLVDQDSTVLLMSLQFPLSGETIPKAMRDKIRALPAMMAARGQEGVIVADDYRGVRVLAAVRRLIVGPGQRWGLVVKRDEAEVFAPLWIGAIYSCLVGFFGLLISGLLIVLVANRISGPINALSRAAREIEAGNLDVRAPVKTSDEIGVLATTFNSMVENLKKRSAEIEHTNKELEAFSYSVSHDLRAPLRSIDGFSQALLEDYYEKIDETGRDYLNRVRAATQHMGCLIDDLLKLSRLTRTEMCQELIDLSGMVNRCLDSLKRNDPDRSVECSVQEGISVKGDPYLMEIAMENLLSNAWKFTGKTTIPKIQFGTTDQEGERVFFIKDNGIGFDMTYSDKLFGAFQRLHTVDEFPGTGIGLATVKRIIHRHGGRIWVQAEPGNGATFFFTV